MRSHEKHNKILKVFFKTFWWKIFVALCVCTLAVPNRWLHLLPTIPQCWSSKIAFRPEVANSFGSRATLETNFVYVAIIRSNAEYLNSTLHKLATYLSCYKSILRGIFNLKIYLNIIKSDHIKVPGRPNVTRGPDAAHAWFPDALSLTLNWKKDLISFSFGQLPGGNHIK